MTRTTDKDLNQLCDMLNKDTDNRYDFSIGHAYGGVRLESHNGSRDVSPRLSKGELSQWMHAFHSGLSHATKAGYYGETPMYAKANYGTRN